MLIDVLLLLDFMSCNNEDPLENSATSFTEVNILDCLTVRNCCLESDDITMQVIGNCQESVLRLCTMTNMINISLANVNLGLYSDA